MREAYRDSSWGKGIGDEVQSFARNLGNPLSLSSHLDMAGHAAAGSFAEVADVRRGILQFCLAMLWVHGVFDSVGDFEKTGALHAVTRRWHD